MRSVYLLRPIVAAAASLLVAAGGWAESDGTDVPFVEQIAVEVVNVDVWVTDRQGRPVDDLARADFVVYRDGAEVPITNFYSVAAPAATTADSGAAPSPPRPPIAPRDGAPEPAAEHRLWLVVYVDNFNLHPLQRNRILPDLELFLARHLAPGVEAMLVSYDRSLEVLAPFSDDPRALSEAWAGLEETSGGAAVRASERGRMLRQIADARTEGEAMAYARTYAEAQMGDAEATARALERLIESLAGLPGRKALLYVTSGVPMTGGEELFQAVADRFASSRAYAEIPRHDTRREFERVARQATANRVVFYTVDASGLRGMTLGAAEYGNFLSLGLRSTLESTIQANEQSSLRLLADATGGLAIVNRNEVLPALEEAAADFTSFYSLGIASVDADRGGYHELEVEVNRADLVVRHRLGYRSRGVDGRMIDNVRSALLYEIDDNPLSAMARRGREEKPASGRGRVVPVTIEVPLASLVLLPVSEGRHELRLKLYVGAADSDGDISEIDVVPLGRSIAAEHLEAARRESFVYTHRLLMEAGRQKIALGLLDAFGQRHSLLSLYVDVGGTT